MERAETHVELLVRFHVFVEGHIQSLYKINPLCVKVKCCLDGVHNPGKASTLLYCGSEKARGCVAAD